VLLEFLESDPAAGRLLIVESLGVGPSALERRGHATTQIIQILDQARTNSKASSDLPPLTAEGVLGGVLSILHARLSQQNPEHPVNTIELLGPLMGMIVLPYLGPAAARKEIARPIPKRQTRTPVERRDPLRDMEMRLTYRTVRTLMAVAEQPGSSNRTVANGAGIADQGQISKLLARLHSLNLIENTGTGPDRGAPNAWTLTARGWEVHAAIAQQTTPG
jgi:hypothetical protein